MKTLLIFTLATLAFTAQAQVHKCTDAKGKTVYSDARCDFAPDKVKTGQNTLPVTPGIASASTAGRVTEAGSTSAKAASSEERKTAAQAVREEKTRAKEQKNREDMDVLAKSRANAVSAMKPITVPPPLPRR